MKYAFFPGCKIPAFQPQYDTSTRLVLNSLGVDLADVEFNCCGYPVRHLDYFSYIFSAARNLALAGKQDLDLLTPCKCCYGSLAKARHVLSKNHELRSRVNQILAEEGLEYTGKPEVRHLLQVLYHDVGLDKIKKSASRPFDSPRIAVHYGCHALRPSNITNFDNPYNPRKFDELVEATGAVSVVLPRKVQCCGNPLWEKNNELSMLVAGRRLNDARNAGADYICVACTYCQIQFDTVQEIMVRQKKVPDPLPSILYPQLLGLSMGFSEQELGLDLANISSEKITVFRKLAASA
jgi:heterodisulfide reductase subunit B2